MSVRFICIHLFVFSHFLNGLIMYSCIIMIMIIIFVRLLSTEILIHAIPHELLSKFFLALPDLEILIFEI